MAILFGIKVTVFFSVHIKIQAMALVTCEGLIVVLRSGMAEYKTVLPSRFNDPLAPLAVRTVCKTYGGPRHWRKKTISKKEKNPTP